MTPANAGIEGKSRTLNCGLLAKFVRQPTHQHDVGKEAARNASSVGRLLHFVRHA